MNIRAICEGRFTLQLSVEEACPSSPRQARHTVSFEVTLGQGFRNHLLPTPKARRLRGLGHKPRVNKGLPPANQLSVGRRSLLKGCPHRQATGAGKEVTRVTSPDAELAGVRRVQPEGTPRADKPSASPGELRPA